MRASTLLLLGLGIGVGVGVVLILRRLQSPSLMTNEEIVERDQHGRIVRIYRKVRYE